MNFCTRWLPYSTTYSSPFGPERQVVGIAQLPRRRRPASPQHAHQLAVAREHLDAVVAGVGDVEQVAVAGPRARAAHAANWPGPVPALAPALDELAVRVELGDALVLAELGDVVVAVGVLHHVADVAELARLGAGLAADSVLAAPCRRAIDAEAVVVRIADDQVAVAVDAEAAGPAVAVVGRGPGGAEVLAVAVEDLDAGGEIDDVEAILSVDGDGPRPDEIAVGRRRVCPRPVPARCAARRSRPAGKARRTTANGGGENRASDRSLAGAEPRTARRGCLHTRLPPVPVFDN